MGETHPAQAINNLAVIACIAVLVASIWHQGQRNEFRGRARDVKYAAGGFAAWIAGVVWDNVAGLVVGDHKAWSRSDL